jgi:hypothetical protein
VERRSPVLGRQRCGNFTLHSASKINLRLQLFRHPHHGGNIDSPCELCERTLSVRGEPTHGVQLAPLTLDHIESIENIEDGH